MRRTPPHRSRKRGSKTANVRFSSELNAATAAFMLNVAFRKSRAFHPTKWVAVGRHPDVWKMRKMPREGNEWLGDEIGQQMTKLGFGAQAVYIINTNVMQWGNTMQKLKKTARRECLHELQHITSDPQSL